MLKQEPIDALRHQPIRPMQHFIEGRWQPSQSGERLEVRSPIDGAVLTHIQRAGAADVDAAVSSARRAFDDGRWSKASPQHRKAVMLKWAELIDRDALELAVLGVRDNGTEISMAFKAECGSASANIRYYAEAIDKVYGQIAPTADSVLGLVHHEPVGVVAAIVPWNFPLMIGTWKLAPAIATGNSVVLKPAESASLTLLKLAELASEAGLPDGVLNVVSGEGAVAGEALALHMDVDVLVFTGSGGVGRRLLEYSARSNLKRVYLELGGKSPNVVFADAPDLDKAAAVSAAGIFRNSGQVCIAGSRLLVQRQIHDEFVSAMSHIAEGYTVGNPLDLSSQLGAINSEAQLNQNLGSVQRAITEGASVATGGARVLLDSGGYYMEPTIVTGVDSAHALAQQEVFGPVLAVIPFDTEQQAIALANDSVYGLAAGVWTGDLGRAHRMVRAINTGVVHVNTYGGADLSVPLGGVKQSGNGHDKSLHALEKYQNLKTAWIQL